MTARDTQKILLDYFNGGLAGEIGRLGDCPEFRRMAGKRARSSARRIFQDAGVLHMNNLVNVCVDSYENGDICGRYYTAYSMEPTLFTGTVSFLLKLEQFYDRLGYPMATTEHRRFHGKTTKREEMSVVAKDELYKHQGETATFLVRVRFRQNSTWQGTLQWMDGRKEVSFRSALELIRLIDSAHDFGDTADDDAKESVRA